MNYREHGPPHFHAWYAGHEVTVKIGDGLELHRDELREDWKRAEERLPLIPIDPLE